MRSSSRLIIEGTTKEGKTFRPSDWAERISDLLATFGRDQRIRYSPLLQPIVVNGVRSVAMDLSLQKTHPEIYQHVINFAESNRLKIIGDVTGPLFEANAA